MKPYLLFSIFIVAAYAATEEYCYKDAVKFCSPSGKAGINSLANCNARYGAIEGIAPDLQAYVNRHITRSFEYLLMATHYGNYEKNRDGFEKVFRELSDSKWEESINLIKYITKRGEQMNFSERKGHIVDDKATYELYELESFAKALDIEKDLAHEAHRIHGEATRKLNHDPEISSYLENHFVHKHADIIRTLSGYVADLSSLLKGPDSSLALYLFDSYLQNQSFL